MTVRDKYVQDKIDELIKHDGEAIDEIAKSANLGQMLIYKYFVTIHSLVYERMEKDLVEGILK